MPEVWATHGQASAAGKEEAKDDIIALGRVGLRISPSLADLCSEVAVAMAGKVRSLVTQAIMANSFVVTPLGID
jgi:hypothetical protein